MYRTELELCSERCDAESLGRVLAVQRRLLYLWFLVVRSEPGHSPCQPVSGTKYDGQHDYRTEWSPG